MRHMNRLSVEPWIENVGESGCLEPAFKQNTNDDDFSFMSYKSLNSKELSRLNSYQYRVSIQIFEYPVFVNLENFNLESLLLHTEIPN